ncbi:dna topoisomerase [Cystoisospora suis]|uniref:DNA topoisomerase 2 n=1 Tax=Cystoisospora suis TaxID=483139 RepID=A0A2C6KFE2_9APIC|nr:dna topoisomerase [Cystoisospora suis]
MIFGQLLTSDNYDDSECRVTGGRNGYGAKLTNIFSQEFTVECADGERKKKFRMTWTGNMGKKTEPEISNYPGTDFVKISFIPDFAKFGMTGWEPDILSLLRKRAYDLAGTSGVRVYLNGSRIEVNSFSQYVDLYLGGSSDKKRKNKKGTAGGGKKKRGGGEGGEEDAGEDEEDDPSSEEGEDEDDADDDDVWEEAGSARKKKNKNTKSKGKKGRKKKRGGTREEGDAEEEENVDEDGDGPDGEGEIKKVIKIHEKQWRWEVVISSTDGGQFQQVSFVNSICTTKGGSHVTHVIEPLLSAIVKKANAKNRGGMEIKPAHVKLRGRQIDK